jgi:hypothetical protein
MYKQSLFLAISFAFAFTILPARPAKAVSGPSDALALVTTATLGMAGAFSAYSWHQASNPDFILNQVASIKGENSWAAWFMRHNGKIAISTAFVAGMFLSQHCTHTGIAAIDNRFGLPRG